MSDRIRRWVRSAFLGVGGVLSGWACYRLVSLGFEMSTTSGTPPAWLFIATGLSATGYILVRRIPLALLRAWARATLLVVTTLFALDAFVNWQGHGGGYYENRYLRGPLFALAERAPATVMPRSAFMAAVDVFRDDTRWVPDELVEVTHAEDGWAVVIESPDTGRVCALYRGSATSWPAEREGLPLCRLPPPWARLGALTGLAVLGALIGIGAGRSLGSPG